MREKEVRKGKLKKDTKNAKSDLENKQKEETTQKT